MDTLQLIARGAGLLLFLIGFAMLTGGIALLIGGDITFKSGRKLSKPVSRKVGILFVSFFPLVLIANFLLQLIDPERAVSPALLNWPIGLTCLVLGLVWLRRGLHGTAEQAPTPEAPAPLVVEVTPLPVARPPRKS